MKDQLSKLFDSTKQLYKTEVEEAINRLSLIRNSSLLDTKIKNSIAPILTRMTEISADIEKVRDKDFEGIHDIEKKSDLRKGYWNCLKMPLPLSFHIETYQPVYQFYLSAFIPK